VLEAFFKTYGNKRSIILVNLVKQALKKLVLNSFHAKNIDPRILLLE
jgi:hypothetical protein